jgi:hypothetical protein
MDKHILVLHWNRPFGVMNIIPGGFDGYSGGKSNLP